MAFAAAVTDRLRLGSLVFNNDARHIVLLAQEAATVDLLSSGRLELGMGCGWFKAEYDRAGISFDPGATRVARLEEAIRAVKSLLSDSPAELNGSAYKIKDLDGQPKPVQRPHPPILVGGGSRRLLSLAAREADIVGIGPRAMPGGGLDPRALRPGFTGEQVDWVRSAAGPGFDQLELHLYVQFFEVTEHRRALAEKLSADFEQPPDVILTSPHVLIGTIDEICSQLIESRRRYGFSYFSVQESAVEAFGPIVARLTGT
jgi:probable F420-dependent oxidoreductase